MTDIEKMEKLEKITLVGAGNVATVLGKYLKKKGFRIIQVYSKTEESAYTLARFLESEYTIDAEKINSESDIYIFSVKDNAIKEILKKFGKRKAVLVHTAGSVPMNVFEGYSDHYGVIYPLQTFSKNRDLDFGKIPLFIEANNAEAENILKKFAGNLSQTVNVINSEKRGKVHLAATFACNFTNYMYSVAAEIMRESGLDRKFLLPLEKETYEKTLETEPFLCQTGPASRNDGKTIQLQEALLSSDKNLLEIYDAITKNISSRNQSDTSPKNENRKRNEAV